MQNGFRKIFVEFKRPEYRIDEIIDGQPIFNESEIKFLEDRKLITKSGNLFKVNFVGELITPNYSFFSFPKNFKIEPEENTKPLTASKSAPAISILISLS